MVRVCAFAPLMVIKMFYVYLNSVRLEQGTVTSLLEENGTIRGVQYKTKSGEEFTAYAPLTIVCDGCFSNLRRSLCDPKVITCLKVFILLIYYLPVFEFVLFLF